MLPANTTVETVESSSDRCRRLGKNGMKYSAAIKETLQRTHTAAHLDRIRLTTNVAPRLAAIRTVLHAFDYAD